MVNLEKMLRQLMESQMQRAGGQPAGVEEEVVDLHPAQVVEPPPPVDLSENVVLERGQLSQRHLKSSLNVEQGLDHQVGRLEREDAETQLTHAAHDLGQLGHENVYEQLHISEEQDSPDITADLAADIIALLKTRRGMVQAVLLSEIIDRPTHRW